MKYLVNNTYRSITQPMDAKSVITIKKQGFEKVVAAQSEANNQNRMRVSSDEWRRRDEI